MQYLKEEVKSRIMAAALKEFDKKGYQKASMKNISKEAKVAIGNIYRYFKNKDELFNAIMEPVNNQLTIMVLNKYENVLSSNLIEFQMENVINDIIDLYSKYRTELIILMEKSEGSKYQDIKQDLINIVNESYKNEYLPLFNKKKIEISDLFLYVISEATIQSMFTVFKEVDDVEEVKKQINLLLRYFYNKLIERFE